MSGNEQTTSEPPATPQGSWMSRLVAWCATPVAHGLKRAQPLAPWKVRLFAMFYLVVFSGVVTGGWLEFQRGFAVSRWVGAGSMLVAAFNILLLMPVLISGRTPGLWRHRKAV